MSKYTCIVCNNEFESKHRSAICPECKASPAICVICGKEFKRTHPYTQKTCSSTCRGIYRKESGIAQSVANKMKQTKLDRYGTLDPTKVSIECNGGALNKRICPLCNKEFQPTAVRQIYCESKHYGPCPVCGKEVEIKDYSIGPQACSEECRMQRIYTTNIERYGNKDSVNSEHAKELAKKHCLEKYGVEFYSQTDEFKTQYKDTIQSRYGVNAPISYPEFKDKAIQTNLEKYGVEWATQSDLIKTKTKKTFVDRYGGSTLEHSSTLREKYESTMLKNHGVIAPTQDPNVIDKIRQTSIDKYNINWASNNPEAIDKRKRTNIERYGSENPYGSAIIQDKIREKWTEKYGGPNPMCDPKMVDHTIKRRNEGMMSKYGTTNMMEIPGMKQRISDTIMEKYGVPWYVLTEDCMKGNMSVISEPNKKFANCLSKLSIPSTYEYRIGRLSYDIRLNDSNILIEIDPTFTHNSYDNIWHDPKPVDYHITKTKVAEENGFRCIHIFDWDNKEAILSMLVSRTKLHARKCTLSRIDRYTAESFTKLYHLQGSCRGQNIVYGLFYEGQLVQMMSFGKPRYNKHYDFELLRLCTVTGKEVIGGPSKLFSRFIKDNPNVSVLSYCDSAKFTGKVYELIGMKLSHSTQPAKVWSKGTKYITDNYLRQRGYDQIFNTNYGKGTSNEQLMLENGWLPVYDCGQKVFVYDGKQDLQ